jgi:hypothetical protein
VRLGPAGVVRIGEHGKIVVGHAAQAIASPTLTRGRGGRRRGRARTGRRRR